MTEAERIHRAQEAARLSEEPLLKEALGEMSQRCLAELMKLPSTAHEERYLAAQELKLISDFRGKLQSIIQDVPRKGPAVA